MASLNINPTRMELMRLKTRLKTTMRGHKLLKDRADEMVRQFVSLIHANKNLRESVENEIVFSLRAFALSQTLMTGQESEEAVAMPSNSVKVSCDYGSLMGIEVPKLSIKNSSSALNHPYSFASTVSQFDDGISKVSSVVERLLELAQIEKTCDILAEEIEKIRRRVNALEQFVIPQIRSEMKRILMKLDENERSNLVRLMKVKELISKDE